MNGRTRIYYRLFRHKPEWSGMIAGNPLFCDVPDLKEIHAFKRHKIVLAAAGVDVGAPDLSWMQADVSLLGVAAPYVLFVPGSAPGWPQKRWPALKYGALGRRLMQQGYAVAALGTAAEREVIDRLVKACPGVVDLCGKTSLYDIATLARGACGAVGNDTGPTHLIALSGCPVTALFCGETRPELSAPVGAAVTVIQADDLSDLSVEAVLKNFHPRETPPQPESLSA
jgi:ADP-heptose:LPS heptosyltransferase